MKKIIAMGGAAVLVMAGAAAAQQSDQRTARWGDADGDGRVAQAEFVDRHVSRLQAMDADNDGVVTAAERTAARQARMAERRDAHFARLDANGDGAIARAEFDAAHEQMGERRGHRGHRGMRGGRGGHHRNASGDVAIAGPFSRSTHPHAGLIPASLSRSERYLAGRGLHAVPAVLRSCDAAGTCMPQIREVSVKRPMMR